MESGKTVSHYTLDRRLGAGGMGEVWLAQDTRLDRKVAIKFLSPLLGSNSEAQERFLREAKATAQLDHPNVVPIHDFGDDNGSTFIVMAYLEGESLRQVLDRVGAHIPLLDILRWGKETARGLAEAHRAGITHRDIKPDNILLNRKREARIADFGLARVAAATQLTQTGAGMGTLRYVSPEQAAGRNVDHRTDLFSLGATLYELLVGHPPFRGDDPAAILYAVAHSTPEPLGQFRKDFPEPLVALVEALLEKDPIHRPQSADVVATALERMEESVSRGETVAPLELVIPPADLTVPIPGPEPTAGGIPTWVKAVVAFAIIAAGVWGVSQFLGGEGENEGQTTARQTPPDPSRLVAMFPFAYTGPQENAHHAASLASMLGFVLQGTGTFELVPSDTLLGFVDRQGLDITQTSVPGEVAAAMDANRYLTGELVAAGGGFQIMATLHDGESNVLLDVTERSNSVEDLQAAMDRLGLTLLEELLDGPTDELRRVAVQSAGSLPALKAYLKGEALYRGSFYKNSLNKEALSEFQAAVAEDSTFAIAHFRITTIAAWEELPALILPSAQAAFRHRRSLPPQHPATGRGKTR